MIATYIKHVGAFAIFCGKWLKPCVGSSIKKYRNISIFPVVEIFDLYQQDECFNRAKGDVI